MVVGNSSAPPPGPGAGVRHRRRRPIRRWHRRVLTAVLWGHSRTLAHVAVVSLATVRAVSTSTIYVALLDESVDVWRPVEAVIEGAGIYRLPPSAPAGETWLFPPGSRVRCEPRDLSEGPSLVVVALVA